MKLSAIIFLSALQFIACSKSNNLLLGRVEAKAGNHIVVVTDCYRMEVPSPETFGTTKDGKPILRFRPCKDADVRVQGNELIVNGISYGLIHDEDSILVDHGKVYVNNIEPSVRINQKTSK